MQSIEVNLPGEAYRILIEPGLLARLGLHVREVAPHARAGLIVDVNVAATHGATARRGLEEAGYDVTEHRLVADESAKTLETVREVYDAMLAARLERGSPVVAVGGGLVGDVAGFAAATYLRGVPLVHVPTTLLAMVDASIGGKTAVNHPIPGGAQLGKNLIGAFWQPRAVVVDPLVLRTLEERQLRCGLAECVKHGMIADVDLIRSLEAHMDLIRRLDPDALCRLIAASARIKVQFVVGDVRESGARALLNLGHTFAHALEPIGTLGLFHGEAVAIGLCAAARCAEQVGRIGREQVAWTEQVLDALGLPTRLPHAIERGRLMQLMWHDKKVAGDRLRLVLPVGPGSAEVVDDVPLEAIETAWTQVGAQS